MNDTTGRAFSILVVDDSQDSADSLTECLKLCGHNASAAYSGRDALDRVAVVTPDVVFLDLTMPRMDGCELAERIVERAVGKRSFLVALTASAMEADRQRCRDVGIDLYLTKPVEPTLISGMLDSISGMLAPVDSRADETSAA